MKRICNRQAQIDALTLCLSVVKPYHYEVIRELEMDEAYAPYEFELRRVEGRYYSHVYSITLNNGSRIIEFGQLKFGLNNGKEEHNQHEDGSYKVWLTINNEVLYSYDFHFLDYIVDSLGMELHNITTIDLCLDTPFKVSSYVRALLHSKQVLTFLNGKRVLDRSEDRPEIKRILSGSLDKDNKYETLCIKQRNAIKDKSKGITITTYDKAAEIRNASDKGYIMEAYGNPTKLYRTEVHLNNEQVKEFLDALHVELSYWLFHDKDMLDLMLIYHLDRVVRFRRGSKNIMWSDILGKV